MTLEGRAALVTGAARRVGREIALALAERGAKVAIHYNRSREPAEALARSLRRSFARDAVAVRAELRDLRAIRRMVEAVGRRFGALHVLVNNASVYEKTAFGRITQEEWDRDLNSNLRAPFFLSQTVAPLMRKGDGGVIINLADWSALRPYTDYIPYCVSKAGLLCLTSALAKALAPKIRVNAIMPGPVLLPEEYGPAQREAVRKATLLKRLGSPADVARAVLYLIEGGDFITGASIAVDGGRLIA
jgi:pteridine reductase